MNDEQLTPTNVEDARWTVNGKPVSAEEAARLAAQALWEKLGWPITIDHTENDPYFVKQK